MGAEFEEARNQLESLIGSKTELVITSGLYKGGYPSSLQEVDNGMVGVSHPTLKGAFLPALRGTELLMKIESSNCVYQAATSVVRGVFNVTIPILWMKLASPLEKVQRRMFVRVPTSIKANAFFLRGPDELPENVTLPAKEWFPVRIADISLGGAGIAIKDDIVRYCIQGGRYLLLLTISGTTFFLVVKLVKIMKKREGSIEVGVAYEGLPVAAEKVMGGYIRQQELITRG